MNIINFRWYKIRIIVIFPSDIDECIENNGGCEHNCINTIGSYNCSCNSGYGLGNDSHMCEGMYMYAVFVCVCICVSVSVCMCVLYIVEIIFLWYIL